jgi:hypothetical protein
MNGLSDEEIEEQRNAALEDAKSMLGEGVREVPSFFKGDPGAKDSPVSCLGRSIQLMGAADCVYFAKGWVDARGCRIEHMIATEYGLEIIKD